MILVLTSNLTYLPFGFIFIKKTGNPELNLLGETMIPIEYDIIIFKEDETYVAYCPELDVSSCGDSVEHVKEMLKTTVRLFLEEAEKMGTLKNIIQEMIC